MGLPRVGLDNPSISEVPINVNPTVPASEVQGMAETLRRHYQSEETAETLDARDRSLQMPPRTVADANPQLTGWLAQVAMSNGKLTLEAPPLPANTPPAGSAPDTPPPGTTTNTANVAPDLLRRADSGKFDDGGAEQTKALADAYKSDPQPESNGGVGSGTSNVGNALGDDFDPPIFTGIGVLSPEVLAEKYRSTSVILHDIVIELEAKIKNESTLRKQALEQWFNLPNQPSGAAAQAAFEKRVEELRLSPSAAKNTPSDLLIQQYLQHDELENKYESQLAAAQGRPYARSASHLYHRPVSLADLRAVYLETYGVNAQALLEIADDAGWTIRVVNTTVNSHIDATTKTIQISTRFVLVQQPVDTLGATTEFERTNLQSADTLHRLLVAQFGAKKELKRQTTQDVLKNSVTMQFLDSSNREIKRSPWNTVNPASHGNFIAMTFWGTGGVFFDMLPTALWQSGVDARYEIAKAYARSSNGVEKAILGLGYGYTFAAQLGAFATSEAALAGMGMAAAPIAATTAARGMRLVEELRAAGLNVKQAASNLLRAEQSALRLRQAGYTGSKIDELENALETIAGEKVASQRLTEKVLRIVRVSRFADKHEGWLRHIDRVVDELVAQGRPKTIVLGEGGQKRIRQFVNREPSRMSEFVEFRPKSLDYTEQRKLGHLTPAMKAETLEFNLLMIQRLHERGFQFKVIGVDSAANASSEWLQAELKLLESLGVEWEVISESRFLEVMQFPKWR